MNKTKDIGFAWWQIPERTAFASVAKGHRMQSFFYLYLNTELC